MAFCTKCGKPLTAGQKFCTYCGQQVSVVMETPPQPPMPKVAPPPPPQAVVRPPAPPAAVVPPPPPVQKTAPPPPPVAKTVAKAASAATSMVRGIDIMASNTKGEWVASTWQPTLPTSSTSLVSKVKNFFTPQHKLAYAWFLLPVLTTMVTIASYIIHCISRLFS